MNHCRSSRYIGSPIGLGGMSTQQINTCGIFLVSVIFQETWKYMTTHSEATPHHNSTLYQLSVANCGKSSCWATASPPNPSSASWAAHYSKPHPDSGYARGNENGRKFVRPTSSNETNPKNHLIAIARWKDSSKQFYNTTVSVAQAKVLAVWKWQTE